MKRTIRDDLRSIEWKEFEVPFFHSNVHAIWESVYYWWGYSGESTIYYKRAEKLTILKLVSKIKLEYTVLRGIRTCSCDRRNLIDKKRQCRLFLVPSTMKAGLLVLGACF